ncbi:MAG: alpha/beta hydrolase [Candidatus Levybacteria bacterium]|nr:alpha/beta hydrolase [Candidatus Levybacteria bacterium]
MRQKIVSGIYKTISYKFISDGGVLIVILPRAGAKFTSHNDLIQELNKFGSVLFVESGYFGISRTDHNFEEITIDKFYIKLYELVANLGFKKVILIGESVGAIHALNYASHYNENVKLLLLSNPALYKPRWLYQPLVAPVLNFGIKTSSNGLLNAFGRLLGKVPENNIRGIGDAFTRMDQTI